MTGILQPHAVTFSICMIGISLAVSTELFAATTVPAEASTVALLRQLGAGMKSDSSGHIVDVDFKGVDLGSKKIDLTSLSRLEKIWLDSGGRIATSFSQVEKLRALKTVSIEGSLKEDAVTIFKRFPNLESLGLYGVEIQDADVALLEGWQGLKNINFGNTSISPIGLRLLQLMPSLQHLRVINQSMKRLGRLQFDDDALTEIAGIDTLRSLTLSDGAKVTDAGVQHLSRLKQLEELRLEDTSLTNKGLQGLCDLARLRVLQLSNTRITDDGLVSLRRLSKLEGLYIHNPQKRFSVEGLRHLRKMPLTGVYLHDIQMTDEGLEILGGMTRLKSMLLGDLPITDDRIAKLEGLSDLEIFTPDQCILTDAGIAKLSKFKRLEELKLKSNQISPVSLSHITGLPLKRLNLVNCQLDRDGLVHLDKLASLESLLLFATPIGDAGLAHVKHMKNLRHLFLTGDPSITDDGLKHLHGLNGLTDLNLDSAKITSAGFDALAHALPNCTISLRPQ